MFSGLLDHCGCISIPMPASSAVENAISSWTMHCIFSLSASGGTTVRCCRESIYKTSSKCLTSKIAVIQDQILKQNDFSEAAGCCLGFELCC